MRKVLFIMILVSISVFIVACSDDTEDSESTNDVTMETEEFSADESSNSMTNTDDAERAPQEGEESQGETISQAEDVDRKVIYTANLRVEVSDYQQTVNDIQTQVSDRGGYIVNSSMQEGTDEESTSGQVTARIPQDQFQAFIQVVEEGSSKVLESSVSGQDVTEEYVDLEARLESQQVVEERLLAFMEEAEATENLLAISNDLANVQGEIEEITGRMNYLENRTDLATVTINIEENNVSISGDDLNTWEQMKDQFMKSINVIMSVFSGIFVFVVGSLPVLIVFGIIGLAGFLIYRKIAKGKQGD
ncbi:DUF4349 domain-containing protein [Virgibacillus sp. NKC19-16]|uniref:DUF4349 domain-containing protein n=1 Tax=Virgibacillus salidurans TaxID=2831673 RepID=UPI001F432FCC|nr:DUF4349 domain-containing protein [Virgibacillus sp. NKC19-16]UJL46193.1 DUF4349 domain-containing protein [Virgibacillus sp. NKC19-16]